MPTPLEKQSIDLLNEVSALKTKQDSLTNSINGLRIEYEDQVKATEKSKKDAKVALEQKQIVERELEDARVRRAESLENLDIASDGLKKAQETFNQFKSDSSRQEIEVREAHAALIAELNGKFKVAMDDFEKIDQKIKTLENKKLSLDDDIEKSKQVLAQLSDKTDKKLSELSKAESDLVVVYNKIADTEERLVILGKNEVSQKEENQKLVDFADNVKKNILELNAEEKIAKDRLALVKKEVEEEEEKKKTLMAKTTLWANKEEHLKNAEAHMEDAYKKIGEVYTPYNA